jgi:uncharacterized protein YlxW (UPF0749 family)
MAINGAEDNGNGKITVAILGERVELLTKAVNALTAEVKESNKCFNQLAVNSATQETRLNVVEDEVEKLRGLSNRNDVITGLVAAAAGMITALFGGRQ